MAEVKILIEGFFDFASSRYRPTISLIRTRTLVLLVDPGSVQDQQEIIDALTAEKLSRHDIDYVVITHSHLDHYRNIGLFPGARTLDYWGIWAGTKFEENTKNRRFTDEIELLMTPGHSYDGLTLLVQTDLGIVGICGDVFWSAHGPMQDEHAQDPGVLEESRAALLAKADWIVPGHGPMFNVANR